MFRKVIYIRLFAFYSSLSRYIHKYIYIYIYIYIYTDTHMPDIHIQTHYIIQHHITLHHIILYHTVSNCIILHTIEHTIEHRLMLYILSRHTPHTSHIPHTHIWVVRLGLGLGLGLGLHYGCGINTQVDPLCLTLFSVGRNR